MMDEAKLRDLVVVVSDAYEKMLDDSLDYEHRPKAYEALSRDEWIAVSLGALRGIVTGILVRLDPGMQTAIARAERSGLTYIAEFTARMLARTSNAPMVMINGDTTSICEMEVFLGSAELSEKEEKAVRALAVGEVYVSREPTTDEWKVERVA